MAKVMVFGTFDLLHPGHLNLFDQAKKYGEELVVVIARDENVKKFKGEPPTNSEDIRRQMVLGSGKADKVLLGSKTNPYAVIEQEQPDVICLGYDQNSFTEGLQQRFPEITIIRLEPHYPDVFKSSLLK